MGSEPVSAGSSPAERAKKEYPKAEDTTDFWIISNYHYAGIRSLEDARERLAQMQAKYPKKEFHILHCKTYLDGLPPELQRATRSDVARIEAKLDQLLAARAGSGPDVLAATLRGKVVPPNPPKRRKGR